MDQTERKLSIDDFQEVKPSIWPTIQHLIDLFKGTMSLGVTLMCLDLMNAISFYFCAHTSGAGSVIALQLSWQIIQITFYAFGIGINQCLNMQISQAVGSGQLDRIPQYITLTFILHNLMAAFAGVIIFFCFPYILYLLPENERGQVSSFLQVAFIFGVPEMLLSLYYDLLKNFLIAFKDFRPFFYISLLVLFTQFSLTYTLSVFMDWKFYGVKASLLAIEFLGAFLALLYVKSKRSELFDEYLSKVSLRKINFSFRFALEYLKNAMGFVFHFYANQGIFIAMSFMAMNKGVVVMNAQIALVRTGYTFIRIPMSLSFATISFVGREMGRRCISEAKKYSISALILYSIVGSLTSSALFYFREDWAELFTTSTATKDLILEIIPFSLCFIVLFDGYQLVLSGILKGISMHYLVSNLTLGFYYIFTIPAQILLFYYFNYGLFGIWIPIGIANSSLFLIYIIILTGCGIKKCQIDWDERGEQIYQRILAEEHQ